MEAWEESGRMPSRTTRKPGTTIGGLLRPGRQGLPPDKELKKADGALDYTMKGIAAEGRRAFTPRSTNEALVYKNQILRQAGAATSAILPGSGGTPGPGRCAPEERVSNCRRSRTRRRPPPRRTRRRRAAARLDQASSADSPQGAVGGFGRTALFSFGCSQGFEFTGARFCKSIPPHPLRAGASSGSSRGSIPSDPSRRALAAACRPWDAWLGRRQKTRRGRADRGRPPPPSRVR